MSVIRKVLVAKNMPDDKVKARKQTITADIPVVLGTDGPVSSLKEIEAFGAKYGYLIMIKAEAVNIVTFICCK